MYRVGFPFWKALARRGVPVMLRVQIRRDEEAGVYLATSPDLDGLAVEAPTLDELRSEALGAAEALLELAVDSERPPRSAADFRLLDSVHCAA